MYLVNLLYDTVTKILTKSAFAMKEFTINTAFTVDAGVRTIMYILRNSKLYWYM